MYETPLTQAPKRARKNSLNQQGRNLEEGTQSGGSLLPGMVRSAVGAIIGIHTWLGCNDHPGVKRIVRSLPVGLFEIAS